MDSFEARFWAKVQKTTGCWTWTGTKSKGYGRISAPGGVMVMAHRLSWEMVHGPIPDGLVVMHICDNPRCVNPDHLVLGTQRTNMLDAAFKGRLSQPVARYCKRGHEFTPENTYLIPSTGRRECHTCIQWRSREGRRARKKAA